MYSKQHVDTFIDEASRERSMEGLTKLFERTVGVAGFDKFACVSAVDALELPEGMVMIYSYPDIWAQRYVQERFDKCDPSVHLALQRNTPLKWKDILQLDDLSNEERRVLLEAADVGMRDGITVQVREPMAFPAVVSVACDHEEIGEDWTLYFHLMAVYLHGSAKRIGRTERKAAPKEKQPRARLTGRETECLRWVAAGKSDWEISEILNISQHTVHGYVEQVKQKYGVPTRQQAIVEGLLDGTIAI